MSDVYYARPVTITDERVRDAMEKQAKQRALREALDSQIHARVGSSQSGLPMSGLSKAQQKRMELMQLQQQQQELAALQQQQQVFQQQSFGHQSNSLPPNYAFASSVGGFGGVGYDSRSLPNNGTMGMLGGGPAHLMHQGGVLSPMHQQQPPSFQQGAMPAMDHGMSPRSSVVGAIGSGQAQQRPFQNPNFNLAEVYAQQQQLHAPARELPVPVSPRQIVNSSPIDQRGGGRFPPAVVGSGGGNLTSSTYIGGGSAPPPPNNNDYDTVHNILRLAKRVTDAPPVGSQSPQRGGYGPAGDIPAPPSVSSEGPRSSAVGAPRDAVPARAHSKETKVRQASTPMDKGKKVAESRVEKLQKELQDRQQEMQRMRDKERDWEDQVKQLKSELKNARQKERDLNKLVNEKPQRAETAPNTGSLSKLVPLATDKRSRDQPPPPPAKGNGGAAGMQANALRKQDFNNARIFSNETFRPITAPLEPIDDSALRVSQHQLPPLPESLKMASFNTRKVAFGLQQTSAPIIVSYEQLREFAKSQIITLHQAESLWQLFSGNENDDEVNQQQQSAPSHSHSASKLVPSPPPGHPTMDVRRLSQTNQQHTAPVTNSPTYETYERLDDEDDEYYDEDG